MNAKELLNFLYRNNVAIDLDGDDLLVDAPEDFLGDDLLSLLGQHKFDIVEILRRFNRSTNSTHNLVQHKSLAPYTCKTTLAQERMLFLEELTDNNSYYNLPFAYKVSGVLNRAALTKAFLLLIKNHEILRTTYVLEGFDYIQLINSESAISINETDISLLDNQKNKIAELLKEYADYKFRLDTEWPIKINVIKLSNTESIISINLHHIAADGLSARRIIHDISQAYDWFLDHPADDDCPYCNSEYQYSDYAIWQTQWLESQEYTASKDYWINKLKGAPHLHSIPTDFLRPSQQSTSGEFYSCALSSSLSNSLISAARLNKTTPFVIFQTAFAALLSRYSGEKDILFGIAAANRYPSEFINNIGLFVNTLAMRFQLAEGFTFSALLAQAIETNDSGLKHQSFPFDSLVDHLQPQRDLSYNSLIQIMLVMQDNAASNLELRGTEITPVTEKQKVSKFDFSLHITPTENNFNLEWEYNTDLFKHSTIETISTHFVRLLEALVETPDSKISKIPLIDSNEVPKTINTSIFPPLRCVHQLIEENVLLHPDAIAIIDGDREFTYQELNDNAERIATQLLANNKNIKRVGLCLNKSAELITAFFAILKMGAVYVPLDPGYPKERLEFMVNDSGMDVLITNEISNLPKDLKVPIPVLCVGDLLSNSSNTFTPIIFSAESPAYIIYTSGSTGKPKGVLVSHKSLFYSLFANQSLMQINNSDSMPTIGSQAFGVSLLEILLPLISGGTVLVLQRADILNLDSLTHLTNKVTVLHAVPSLMRLWLDLLIEKGGSHSYPNLRLLLVGGEAVPDKLLKDIKAWRPQVRLLELYGMTELAVVCSSYEMENHSAINYCIGRPHPNTEFYVLNEDYQHQPIGVSGELHIGGLSLASEYINQPGITHEKFVVNPFDATQRLYKSGDRVKRLADGHYEFLGRVDFQVSVRGVRIECGEIETLALQVEGVKQAVAHVFDTQADNQVLTLYFTLVSESFDQVVIAENIRTHLNQYLPDYMCPSIIQKIDVFPLNPNGKVDRKALPAPDHSQHQKTYLAPRSRSEQIMCDMWQNILGVERVGITDNFFELGGHSLSATRLVARINQTFNVTLPLKTLFTTPTLENLVSAISALENNSADVSLEKVSRDQVLLPSFAQQRLWLLDQIDEGSAHYNLTGGLSISGNLNYDALNKALNSIIERHESLRTCFALAEDGQPIQIIQAVTPLLITMTDLSALEEGARNLQKVEHTLAEASHVFDLSADVMLRAALLKITEDEHFLLVTMHHIASDGWSLSILLNEFCTLYRAYDQNEINPLAPLHIQYADYAHWQRNWLQGDVLDQQLNYWTKQLAGLPVVHSLPLDHVRPVMQSFAGDIYSSRIESQLHTNLNQLCQAQGATLFMGLNAIFSVLLARYSNETDIVVGTPIANREQAEIADLIGFFVNTLVLRNDLSENPDFISLLKQSKRMLLDAYAHQQVPFEQIVERLQPERSLSHSALIQVMLVLQNNVMDILDIPGLILSAAEQHVGIAKYDLTLYVNESADGLELNWEYNTDLFEQETIARMANHFELLLKALVKTPNENVFNVDMLNAQERQQLLIDWNDTQADYPTEKCIHELFEAQVKHNPNAVAVIFEHQEFTYQQLNEKANQLAHYLINEKQIKPDTLVGICVERSLEMIVGILAILKAGGAYVPLDPEYPEARLKYMLDDAKLATVLTQSHLHKTTPITNEQAVYLDDEKVQQELQKQSIQNPNLHELGLTSNHLAYVIYTSGSTGNPKGVMIEHASLINTIIDNANQFKVNNTSVFLQTISLNFDAASWVIWISLSQLARLVIANDEVKAGKDVESYINETKITHLMMTPSNLALLDPQLVTDLQVVIVGGEACSQTLADTWLSQVSFYNAYGPTEVAICSTIKEINAADKFLSIGRPISNIQLHVLNEQLIPVPQNVAGELHIGGVGLARGYLNRADLTAEKFIPNPFHDNTNPASSERLYKTGDLVRWLPSGELEYLGRIDHQVKIRGFRIELGEIENTLSSHAAVKDAIVLAKDSATGDKRLVAYVVTDAVDVHNETKNEHDTEIIIAARHELIESLRHHLGASLPEYMVPSAFVLLEQLPLTPNGKVDRKALPEPDISAQQNTYVAPRTETERVLCDIWQEMLGVARVGINDNFFKLGGHSLLATRLIAQINRTFNVALSLKSVFNSQTLECLGQELLLLNKNFDHPALVSVTREQLLLPSYAQQRLWLLDQIDGGSAHYNMSGSLKLTGELHLEALQQAFTTILERHESLRTCFNIDKDGQPIQVIQAATPFVIPVVDLSECEECKRQLQLAQHISAEANGVFDLSRDLMLRSQLIKVAANEYILLVTMHHIASDGWSMSILINEFSALYSAYIQGKENPLSPLSIQYADYAYWQRNWLQGEVLDQQISYWEKQLAGLPVVHSLPLDHPRPAFQSFVGAIHSSQLDLATSKSLNNLCQSNGATIFMGLHAAFSVLLSRYSNETDIVVGSPIANREQTEVADLIGFFVNTLVLRSDLSENPSFIQLLNQSKTMLLDAYAHQQVPFEQIVERLQPERSLNHSALFQVMLVLQNNDQSILKLPGLTLSPIKQNGVLAKYDLTLNIMETEQGLWLEWEYNTDLFEQDTIVRLANHFELLLKALVKNPNENVFKVELLSVQERQQLLVDWNNTQTNYPTDKCIHELFEAQVKNNPDAVAVEFKNQQLSYQNLNEKANQLAHYLINEKHVIPDTLVGICVERSLDMIVGVLAILKAGGAYVPLDPEYPEARLNYMLDDAKLSTVLTQCHLRTTIPASAAQAVYLDSDELKEQLHNYPTANPDSNSLGEYGLTSSHLAYVIYTSGSTGNPKGSLLNHSGLCNLALAQIDSFGITSNSRILQFASIAFDAATSEIFTALLQGAAVVLLTGPATKSPDVISTTVQQAQITHVTLPPVLLPLLDITQWRSVQTIVVAGDACPLSLASKWSKGRIFINAYGPSETTICATMNQYTDGQARLYIGKPIKNTQAYVLSEQGALSPLGVAGELCIGGVGLSRGYLNRADLTAEKFIPNPFYDKTNPSSSKRLYKTGDLVRWWPDGNLEFIGRIDHQVKIRGFRIELGEIENTLSSHADVKDVIVLAKESTTSGDKRLVAYVVTDAVDLQDDSEVSIALRLELIERLRNHLSASLPDYMVPSAFVLFKQLPLTPNGKVDRKALPEPDLSSQQNAYVAPRTETETILCDIWQDVLGVERVGITDNFFHLGGHSLLVMQVISRLQQKGLPVAARQIFGAPCLKDLAEILNNETTIAPAFKAPANLIPNPCEHISPEMLPLVNLTPEKITHITEQVLGGVGNVQDIYPLAPLQEGILFHHMMSTHGDPYVTPALFKTNSAQAVADFITALQFIINRHDILRTAILWEELPAPVQVVHRQAGLHVTWLTFDKEKDVAAEMRARCAPEQQQMDLGQAPLIRLQVAVDEKCGQHFLLLQLHHIISDHVGLEIIQQELALYSEGRAEDLPVTMPYREFVAHSQHQALHHNAETFFTELLGDIEESTAPFNILDVTGDGSLIAEAKGTIPLNASRQLRTLAREMAISPAVLFHSAWAMVVANCSGRDDVVFGTVLSGRLQGTLGAENMLGVFINTLPLRAKLDGISAAAFVHQMKVSLQNLLPYEQASLALAQRCSSLPSGTPLFTAMLNYRHSAVSGNEANSVTGLELIEAHERTNYPFNLLVDDLGDAFELNVQVHQSIGAECVIGYVQTAVAELAKALTSTPDQAINSLSILPDAERHHLLVEWNNTQTDYPNNKCIHELFEAQVKNNPDAIALVFENQQLSYQRLNEKANQLAHYLINDKQIKPDALVGICVERSLEMVIGILAILKAGGAYVPLDPDYPEARLHYMLGDANLTTVLTQSDLLDSTPVSNAQAVCLDSNTFKQQLQSQSIQNPNTQQLGLTSNHLAYVIYTSGSTGNPKGVMVEHHALVNRIDWMNREYGSSPSDRILQKTPFSFDVSVWEFVWPLSVGARIVLAKPEGHKDPIYLSALIRDQQITKLHFVPSMLGSILSLGDLSTCTSLRQIFCSGEALALHHVEAFYSICPWAELHNLYGPTEAAIDVSYWDCSQNHADLGSVPIGRPIHNIQLHVLNSHLLPVPQNVAGELHIGGVGLARGYLNRDDLTTEKFIPNPFYDEKNPASSQRLYKTGDLVRWLPDGNLEYLGRIDQQVKIRGFRIELGEIESNLSAHADVKDVVVVAKKLATSGDKRLVAYVVTDAVDLHGKNETAVTARQKLIEQLHRHVNQSLPDYMVPSAFVLLEQLPLTPNGKVDRKGLPELDISAQQNMYVAPRTEIEKTLCTIWQEVLGVEEIGITDNFFQLGGHSLSVLRLVSDMNSALTSNIKVKDIFAAPTIESLMKVADFTQGSIVHQQLKDGLQKIKTLHESIKGDSHLPSILPEDIEDFYPLSPIQQSMVFFAQTQPELPLYHDQFSYVLSVAHFNLAAFTQAVADVSQLHSILRTSFDVTNFSMPLQFVHRQMPVNFVLEDLSSLATMSQQTRIEAYCQQDLQKRFKLELSEPLWRLGLFNLGGNEICVVLSFQHAILDGWSVNTLTDELMLRYSALNHNLNIPIAHVTHSYKDYVAIYLARSVTDEARSFWQDYLQNYSRMKLPFNYAARPLSDEAEMRVLQANVNAELLQKLLHRSRIDGFSIKEICLAAHVYLLSLLSGDSEVLTGVVSHNRPELQDAGRILGCFLNTVPLRISVASSCNKHRLLQTVQQYLRQVKNHELFLGDIARAVGEYNPTGNPLFDTIFNFTDFPVKKSVDGERSNENISFSDNSTKIAVKNSEMTNTFLDIEVHKQANQSMVVQVKYVPKYFHSREIDVVMDVYLKVLELFSSEGHEISSVQIIKDINNHNHSDFNQTDRPYRTQATLHQLFEEQVVRTPTAVALRQQSKQLSYDQLNRRANQMARMLINKGVKPGDQVGIIMERSFDLIAGIYGILKAGAAYVPMEPDYPLIRKQAIEKSAGLTAILVDHSIEEENNLYIHVNTDALAGLPDGNLDIEKNSLELAYIIYTSGSTGKPKGVRIPHHAAVNLVAWVNREFAIDATDTMLFITSVCFDLSVYDIFGLLSAGGSIVIAEQTQVHNPGALLELIKTERITFWDSVPTTLNHLISALKEYPVQEKLDSLRLVFLSGDWIPVHLPTAIKQHFPKAQVISLGGATEGTVWSNYYPVLDNLEHRHSIPYGKPIDNNRFYILDSHQHPVINGVVGELYIAGVGVADGYQDDHERTAKAFFKDCLVEKNINGQPAFMYKTGDLGRLLPCGNMELHGRVDHQVKLRGFRIELGEIESLLNRYEFIKEAVVNLVSTPASSGQGDNQYLVGYVVAKSGVEISTELLMQYLAEYLPEYMVPKLFVTLASLPLTQNGKVDRKALPEPDMSTQQNTYVAPRTEIERAVCDIWQEVLELENVGITDNFFLLGGHSLTAARLVARINQTFKVTLPLKTLFTAPTVESLVVAIAALESDVTRGTLEPVSRDQVLLASHAQQRYWLMDQVAGGGSLHNMPGAFRLSGNLDYATLNHVLSTILERHESLRTCFTVDTQGQLVQLIQPPVPLSLAVTDLSSLEEGTRQLQQAQLMAEEATRSFALDHDLMLRAQLLKLADNDHLLLLTMHHIASDGWSLGVLINEVRELYTAYQQGENNPLAPLAVQYADYAYWQRQALADHHDSELRYWLNELSGAAESTPLPLDYPRHNLKTNSLGVAVTHLDAKHVERFTKAIATHNGTLFSGLFASLSLVLHRWCAQDDVVVGVVDAGRDHPDIEPLIGCFINTLAIRSQVATNETLPSFLGRTCAHINDVMAHKSFPFDALVNAINPDRAVHSNPLFNVGLLLQNLSLSEVQVADLEVTQLPLERTEALLDLRFVIEETPEGLTLSCDYRQELFAAESIGLLLEAYRSVIDQVIDQANNPVSDQADRTLADLELPAGLLQQAQHSRQRQYTVCVAGTFTLEPLADSFYFWRDELGLDLTLEFTPFQQVFQQLLDAGSELRRNQNGVNLLLLSLQDWLGVGDSAQQKANLQDSVQRFISALDEAQGHSSSSSSVPYILMLCPSMIEVCGDQTVLDAIAEQQQLLQAKFQQQSRVRVVLPETLERDFALANYLDFHSYTLGHIPYTPAYYSALMSKALRLFSSYHRKPYKVLVLDCDNTLWHGVCAETGAQGVQISDSYRYVQNLAIDLHAKGLLLCLCSANEPDDVWAVFDQQPDMLITRKHLVSSRINWEPKWKNIHSLADELNLGLDSFIFIDDDALQCAQMKEYCPQVLTLQLPVVSDDIPDFLNNVWALDVEQASALHEDRTALYEQNSQREQLSKRYSNNRLEFLDSLALTIDLQTLNPGDCARAAELLLRTNQFNFTGTVIDEAELKRAAESTDTSNNIVGITARVDDRFGSYGLVGLALFRVENTGLTLINMVLSCRALGRGVEYAMVKEMARVAREQHLDTIQLPFTRTARNTPALQFLNQLRKVIEAHKVSHPESDNSKNGNLFAVADILQLDYRVLLSDEDASSHAESTSSTSPHTEATSVSISTTRSTNQLLTPVHYSRIAELSQRFAQLDELIQTNAQQRQLARRSTHVSEYVAPETETEQTLSQIWKDILKVDSIGITDNFFDLGGNSLLAARLVRKINVDIDENFKISHIFQFPTIEESAQAITKNLSVKPIVSGEKYNPAIDYSVPVNKLFYKNKALNVGAYHTGSVFLDVQSKSITFDLLQQAFSLLIQMHPILNSKQYVNAEGELVHTFKYTTEKFNLIYKDFTVPGEHDVCNDPWLNCDNYITTIPGSFTFTENDRLFKAFLFNCGENYPQRLFIIWHHNILDGFSIDTVVSDFDEILSALLESGSYNKQKYYTSITEWYDVIGTNAKNNQVQDLHYWKNQPWNQVKGLPQDKLQDDFSANAEWADEIALASMQSLWLDEIVSENMRECLARAISANRLSAEKTKALYSAIISQQGINAFDVILLAISRVFSIWAETDTTLVEIINSGRGLIFPDFDNTRTIGDIAFNTPLLISSALNQPALPSLHKIYEERQDLPRLALSYKWNKNIVEQPKYADFPQSQILINYDTGNRYEAGTGLNLVNNGHMTPGYTNSNYKDISPDLIAKDRIYFFIDVRDGQLFCHVEIPGYDGGVIYKNPYYHPSRVFTLSRDVIIEIEKILDELNC